MSDKMERDQEIIQIVQDGKEVGSSFILEKLTSKISIATLKRDLQSLCEKGFLTSKGKGKGTKYSIGPGFELFHLIDVDSYFNVEIDDRTIKPNFDIKQLDEHLDNINLFSKDELDYLNHLQSVYEENVRSLTDFEYNKEMERLAIDLSWKSSQIEGNTYTLLETERLLREKETAGGKSKDEAIMLLNHKDAIDFIISEPDYVEPLTISSIEDIHSLLIKELNVGRNIRQRRVGISGTNYIPLDNEFQIREALQNMCNLINKKSNVFEKAFLALILLSYIQAFNDGNKRTARIVSNAILLCHKYCPLSFRTVDSLEYKKALLIFYEQHNVSAFKTIFIKQYEFAVNTYF